MKYLIDNGMNENMIVVCVNIMEVGNDWNKSNEHCWSCELSSLELVTNFFLLHCWKALFHKILLYSKLRSIFLRLNELNL